MKKVLSILIVVISFPIVAKTQENIKENVKESASPKKIMFNWNF